MELLELKNITKRFGGVVANRDISLTIEQGELVGLIGPNGAGKTTLFNIITGTLKPTEGTIIFNGADVTGWNPNRSFQAGVARTFQVVRPFDSLTCIENVLVPVKARFPSLQDPEEKALSTLEVINLEDKAELKASQLNYAEKRKLELARAIASEPQILMLDEVMAGLNPAELDEMLAIIQFLQQEREITIIAVEHVMKVIMNLSNHIYVLNNGELIADGTPEEISSNELVIKAYLGDDEVVAG